MPSDIGKDQAERRHPGSDNAGTDLRQNGEEGVQPLADGLEGRAQGRKSGTSGTYGDPGPRAGDSNAMRYNPDAPSQAASQAERNERSDQGGPEPEE